MALQSLVDTIYNRFKNPLSDPNITVGIVGAASGVYKYRVVVVDETGETPGEDIQITNGPASLNGSYYITLSWNSVLTARKYEVYGRTVANFGKLIEIPATSDTTSFQYIDYGINIPLPNTAPPSTNTTGRQDWDSVEFIPGRDLQASEMNEIQSIGSEYLKRTTETLFADGDIIKGCNVSLTTGSVTSMASANGSSLTYTISLATVIHAYSFTILHNGSVAGYDNGAGQIVAVNNSFINFSNSTVNYTTGAVSISYTTAPGAGVAITCSYNHKLTIESGSIYIRGKIRYTPGGTVYVQKYSTETLGITLTDVFYDETDDIILLDPAQGVPGYSMPGALRRVVQINWVRNETGAIAIQEYLNGDLQKISVGYSVLEKTLARKINDISGHVLIEGLTASVFADSVRRDKVKVELKSGKAYVNGYEVIKPSITFIPIDIAKTTEIVSGEEFSSYSGLLYNPDSSPVSSVTTSTMRKLATETGNMSALPVVSGWRVYTLNHSNVDELNPIGLWTSDPGGPAVSEFLYGSSGDYVFDGSTVKFSEAVFPVGNEQFYLRHLYFDTAIKGSRTLSYQVDTGFTKTTDVVIYTLTKKDIIPYEKVNDFTMYIKDQDNIYYYLNTDFTIYTGATIYGFIKSKIEFTNGAKKPADGKTFTVYYYYWAHTSEGDYVSIDSYLTPSDPYGDYKYDDVSAKDSLDFRKGTNQPLFLISSSTTTGTNEAHDHNWEGFKFNSSIGTMGTGFLLTLKVKRDSTVVQPNSTLYAYLFSDSTGSPGTILAYASNVSEIEEASAVSSINIETTYHASTDDYIKFVFDKTLTADTSYWIIFVKNIEGTGTFYLDGTNTGTGLYAYSNSATTSIPGSWTLENSKEIWHNIETFTPISATYEYFLPEDSWLVINEDSSVEVIRGSAARYPVLPQKPYNKFCRYRLKFNAFDQDITVYEEKRYKVMKQYEINSLRSRIDTLEYNVAMNTVEQELHNKDTTAAKKAIFTDAFVDASRCILPTDKGMYGMDFTANTLNLYRNDYDKDLIYKTSTSTCRPILSCIKSITMNYGSSIEYKSNLIWTEDYAQAVNPYDTYASFSLISLYPDTKFWTQKSAVKDVQVTLNIDEKSSSSISNTLSINSGSFSGAEQIAWRKSYYSSYYSKLYNIDPLSSFNWASSGKQLLGQRQLSSTTTIGTSVESVYATEIIKVIPTGTKIVIKGSNCPSLQDNIRCEFNNSAINISLSQAGDFTADLDSTIMGSTGTETSPNTTIKANSNGKFTGTITIPDNTPTGTRSVKVYTQDGFVEGHANFESMGTLNHMQRVTTSLTRRVIQDVYVTQNVIWYDPIAESFLLTEDIFVDSVDIWVYKIPVDTSAKGLTVQIRGMTNGYPNSTIYGEPKSKQRSEIVDESLISGTTGVLLNAPTESNGRVRFTFEDPIYLPGNSDYCICILSEAPGYYVFTSRLGKKVIGDIAGIQTPGKSLDKNPFPGVMFMSVNGSTWTADQTSDLMFRLNRTNFITTSAYVIYDDIINDGVSFSDFVHCVVSECPSGTGIDFQYLNGSNWTSYTPIQYSEDGSKTTSNTLVSMGAMSSSLSLRALLTTTKSTVSPIIKKSVKKLVLYNFNSTGEYQSEIIDLSSVSTTFTNISLWMDELTNGGIIDMTLSFDSGVSWYPVEPTSSISLSNTYTEYAWGGTVTSISNSDLTDAVNFSIKLDYSNYPITSHYKDGVPTSMVVSGVGPYTMTVTCPGTHGFTTGASVLFEGMTPSGWNGVWTIASTPSTTSFTFTSNVTYGTVTTIGTFSRTLGIGNGSTTQFTGTLYPFPIVKGSIQILHNGKIIGKDDKTGYFDGVNINGLLSTINHTTGAYSIRYNTAPASNVKIKIRFIEDVAHSNKWNTPKMKRLRALTY